jgi:hypothetical protein
MTFPHKEDLIVIEQLLPLQKLIHDDAEDFGILIRDTRPGDLDPAREALKRLKDFYGCVTHKWGDTDSSYGRMLSLFIPIEEDEGLWAGTVVTATFNHDSSRRLDYVSFSVHAARMSESEAQHAYGSKILKEKPDEFLHTYNAGPRNKPQQRKLRG